MNYGHPLKFGIALTPQNDAPEQVVALAKRAEALGYDLVTFREQEADPASLDSWTLLAWAAGETERIQLAPNALSLEQRLPSVLGRAAASLDLLSDGRLNLALGAADSSDEGAEALDEGIEIIRGMLDAGESSPLRFNGRHYHVNGAQRGPAPAHTIPIWLSGVPPRMLSLTGEKADGWVVSLNDLKPGEFYSANQMIDGAASATGRDPREIRRIVNISGQFSTGRSGFLEGTSEHWVEDLLPLVVDDGAGTLILVTNDEQSIEQFAREVMPALRNEAKRALPQGFPAAVVRSAAVRAKRRNGIDYDRVPETLADAVIEPGDAKYARVKSTYMRGGAPGIVFQVRNSAQIVEALAFAKAHPDLPLGIRSGGHGISGRSTNQGGIVIDLSRLNKIEVLDEAARLVRIEPGARWMDVAAALEPYGWALSSGDYGGVGVGGLATAGGVGFLVREHGLTIDHLRAVEMILADGTQVRASDEENPDLFWAVRGAGGNFGIVTAFEFEVDEVGAVGWAQLVFDASDMAGFLEKWGTAVEAAPRDLTSFLIMGPPRRGQPAIAQVMAMVDSDQPDTIINRLQPIAEIAPMYDQQVVITSYANVMANAQRGDHNGQGEPVGRSGLIEHITPEFAAAAERLLHSGDIYFFQIRSVGGAVADVDPNATAYGYRAANFSVVGFGANRARVNMQWDALAAHFDGLYLSFETDLRPERLHDAFPPATLDRLRTLKQHYDPDNLFRDNFNVAREAVTG